MHALPTNPTILDLINARESFKPAGAIRTAVPGKDGLLVEALRRHVRAGGLVLRNVPVVTPDGRLSAPIVIVAGEHRIAVVSEADDTENPEETAAMLLVSAPFDAVYRVSERSLTRRVTAVAWEIARREPRLFDDPALRMMMLCASSIERRAKAADRPAVSHLAVVPLPDVRPMRLNRPSEWSDAYERAMRSIEARQIPLFARSA